MKLGTTIACLSLTGLAAFLGQSNAGARPADDGGTSAGADVIVGAIPDYTKYYKGTINGETWLAYAFGSTSCNIGNEILQWQAAPSNQHPVIPQNLYRVKDGGFEHIGVSWVKHGFCALQQNLCGTCQPVSGGCPSSLGVGCSDPYTASLNGAQSDLRPRFQINPSTGYFNTSQTDPGASDPAAAEERLRVKQNDLNPTLNAGAQYFAECQYIHPQDAAAGNALNNASYRKVLIGADSSTGYALSFSGTTVQQVPAIYAWQVVHSDVSLKTVDIAGDGRFNVASRAWEVSPGVWHYEYVVHNLNSDRAGYSFSVPVPTSVTVNNIGFARPLYHSGEPFANDMWTGVQSGGAVTWTCPQTYAQNTNGAAIRWASAYTFRFECSAAPASAQGVGTIGLFKPGNPTSGSAPVAVPGGPSFQPGDLNQDGAVDGADLGILLSNWGAAGGDIDGNGSTDGADLGILLSNWG